MTHTHSHTHTHTHTTYLTQPPLSRVDGEPFRYEGARRRPYFLFHFVPVPFPFCFSSPFHRLMSVCRRQSQSCVVLAGVDCILTGPKMSCRRMHVNEGHRSTVADKAKFNGSRRWSWSVHAPMHSSVVIKFCGPRKIETKNSPPVIYGCALVLLDVLSQGLRLLYSFLFFFCLSFLSYFLYFMTGHPVRSINKRENETATTNEVMASCFQCFPSPVPMVEAASAMVPVPRTTPARNTRTCRFDSS